MGFAEGASHNALCEFGRQFWAAGLCGNVVVALPRAQPTSPAGANR